jgi:hypothetical protein
VQPPLPTFHDFTYLSVSAVHRETTKRDLPSSLQASHFLSNPNGGRHRRRWRTHTTCLGHWHPPLNNVTTRSESADSTMNLETHTLCLPKNLPRQCRHLPPNQCTGRPPWTTPRSCQLNLPLRMQGLHLLPRHCQLHSAAVLTKKRPLSARPPRRPRAVLSESARAKHQHHPSPCPL